MSIELDAFHQLDLAGQLSQDENFLPSKAKDGQYTKRLTEFRKKNPNWRRKRPPHRKLSHTKAMECFERCVRIQAKKERNSFKRRARLLKAAKDLGLSSLIKREEISQQVLEAKLEEQGEHFQLLSATDREAMEMPVVRWLLPGVLPAGDLTILGGRPKVGKTRLAMAMASAVINGSGCFGLPSPSKPSSVLVCTDDQSEGDSAEMLKAVGLYKHPQLKWSKYFRLNERDINRLIESIKANPGALVIIDSLRSISRSCQHGENDPESGVILYDLKQAVVEAGGTLLLIHHCNKAMDLVGVEALSGHNAIAGAANTVLTMHYVVTHNTFNKQAPERRLVREARSGEGFDLVITREGSGGFKRVCEHRDWESRQKENAELSSLTGTQQKVLDLLDTKPTAWWTRRQVCEALDVEWVDRGKAKECKRVTNALRRLVALDHIASEKTGLECTYQSLSSRDEQHEDGVMGSTSHTNGFDVTPSSGVTWGHGVTQHSNDPVTPSASNKVGSRDPLAQLVDPADPTDPIGVPSLKKTFLFDCEVEDVPIGSGADVQGDGDPAWGPPPEQEAC